MKKLIVLLLILLGITNVIGQTLETVEKRINYRDGYEIVNMLKNDITISYIDELDYFWYDESSGVNHTKGGSGGRLLHGKLRTVIDGILRIEGNYNLGLKDGDLKQWDSLGDITVVSKYSNGICIYVKTKNEEGGFKETIGEFFSKGRIDKYYKKYEKIPYCKIEYVNGLLGISIITYYYQNSRQIYETYESLILGDFDEKSGFYKSFYNNGKPFEIGQYVDGLRTGEWKYFKTPQSPTFTIHKYKTVEENWENGKPRVRGSQLLINGVWEMDGEWYYYKREGGISETKFFKIGIEQSSN